MFTLIPLQRRESVIWKKERQKKNNYSVQTIAKVHKVMQKSAIRQKVTTKKPPTKIITQRRKQSQEEEGVGILTFFRIPTLTSELGDCIHNYHNLRILRKKIRIVRLK